jgi:hypothetical protein
MTIYAGDNNENYLPLRQQIPNTLNDPGAQGAISVGLNVQTKSSSIWSCPDRGTIDPGLPTHEGTTDPAPNNFQWTIGYSYLGGVTNWVTDFGTFAALSPVKTTRSKPWWVLGADSLYKVGTPLGWADQVVLPTDPRYYVYANCPPHKKGSNAAGGNEVFVDGSAAWRNFSSWYRLVTWAGAYPPKSEVYISQDTGDFPTTLIPRLSNLH